MAVIAYSPTNSGNGDLLVTWENVTESDTFAQFELKEVVSEISVHVSGTFGGATVEIKGGNISGEMLGLLQLGGSDASATSADIFSLLDRPLFVQPVASGGSGQSVSVYMLVRK